MSEEKDQHADEPDERPAMRLVPGREDSGGDESRAGDRADATVELFEQAVRQHTRRLTAIARAIVGNRASAEDIVQQAVLNLFQHRQRYDWREPGGLLRRTVVNEALRVLRQPRMAPVTEDPGDLSPGPGMTGGGSYGRTPIENMIDDETVGQVRRAIDRLPEHFRAALVLCEYEQMSYVQIAEVLGASVPQVKTWLHRGRRQLAEMLKGYVEGNRKTEDEGGGRKRRGAEVG